MLALSRPGFVFIFPQLRQEGVKLPPNGNPLPTLFEFTELELSANPRLQSYLMPSSSGGGKAQAGSGSGAGEAPGGAAAAAAAGGGSGAGAAGLG